MASLEWDQTGSRFYESGVDRGVLYLSDGNGVCWNGLISVTEKSSRNVDSSIYFDGVKYADVLTTGEFAASLVAYTYPDEFLEFEGILDAGNGLFIVNQQSGRFSLSYRTKIGNDVDGDSLGYKIHLLYNLTAVPSDKNYQTFPGQPIEFEWDITSIPSKIPGFQPTAHIILDTRSMSPLLLQDLERTLYGTEFVDAQLPSISTLVSFIGEWVIIRITDNLDGTWTATGPDELITMLDATTFQIIQANAVYLDADTYMVSDLTY